MPYKKSSEKDLIKKARKGDREAFNELFVRYGDRLFNTAYRYLDNAEDAKDMVQEAFLKAFKSFSRFGGSSTFYTWIYRILVNCCLTFRRKKKRKVFSSLSEKTSSLPSYTEDDRREKKELSLMFQKAMESLPEKYEILLRLYYIEGLTYRETASIIGIPRSTVFFEIKKGLELLAEKLEELENE